MSTTPSDPAPSPPPTNEIDLEDELYNLEFAVERSIRYHGYRQHFFLMLDKCTHIITFLASTSAVAGQLYKMPEPVTTLILIVLSVMAVTALVARYQDMIALHGQLRDRFADLQRDICANPSAGLDDFVKWRDRRLQIEKMEPSIYRALDVLCHNEIVRARDLPRSHAGQVGPIQRLLRHVWKWREHKLGRA